VEAACVRSVHHLHRRALRGSHWGAVAVWGRRSVFRLDGQALLVCEMFLPDLFARTRLSRDACPPMCDQYLDP
jgi:chorismate-pyruvate lyase